MANELQIIKADVLTPEESTVLNTEIDRIIAAHKNNRREINRLVFDSVAAMTEADTAQRELSGKGFFKRMWGGLTGSNQRLRDKIASNRAAAQYAAQQTLQKLAEQNLMTFDLIAAVNNKLNASMQAVGVEFERLYEGLGRFFIQNRNDMVRMETRLARVERNVNLLTWQNSVEYLDFNGEEYSHMDDTKKIVCLVRDFYDITQGEWTTSDLLLLKAAMAAIGMQPRAQVNYYGVLKSITKSDALKEKLLGGAALRPVEDPGSLLSVGTIKKLDALGHEEAYTVDTLEACLHESGIPTDREALCDRLTQRYLKNEAAVNVDTEVECYDMMLDLLYNLRQAEEEKLLEIPRTQIEVRLEAAEKLLLAGKYDEAFDAFSVLAEEGNGRAMYHLGEYYVWSYGGMKADEEKAAEWREKGAAAGDVLAKLNTAYSLPEDYTERSNAIFEEVFDEVLALAAAGDIFAQDEVGTLYRNGSGVEKNYEEAVKWYRRAAEQGYARAQNNLGVMYHFGNGVEQNYEEEVKWYRRAVEQGNDWAQNNLGNAYENGWGVTKNEDEAIKWWKKAAKQGNESSQKELRERGIAW